MKRFENSMRTSIPPPLHGGGFIRKRLLMCLLLIAPFVSGLSLWAYDTTKPTTYGNSVGTYPNSVHLGFEWAFYNYACFILSSMRKSGRRSFFRLVCKFLYLLHFSLVSSSFRRSCGRRYSVQRCANRASLRR